MYKCEECNIEFDTFQAKANHHRWKHLKYHFKNEDTKQLAKETSKNVINNRYGEIKYEKVICDHPECNNIFEIKYRKKKNKKYFCSKKCSFSYSTFNREEISKKIKNALKGRKIANRKIIKCINCNNDIEIISTHNRKFCSSECKHQYYIKGYSEYTKYKKKCYFNFSLNDFPDEFDFTLIEKYGWYKAKNHGDNLNGISRDHMFSIKEGFLQNIDPEIISHPANCQLLRHNDNVSKNKKCSLTLIELQNRIKEWNLKYN